MPAGDGSGSHPAPLAAISQLPLYPGSQITALQSYLLIFQFAIRHSMTTKSFTELLQLLSVHLPVTATIPKSVHKLKRVFMECFLIHTLSVIFIVTTAIVLCHQLALLV